MSRRRKPARRGPRAEVPRCPLGHAVTGTNVRWYSYRGERHRRCRICANAYMRGDLRASRRKDDVCRQPTGRQEMANEAAASGPLTEQTQQTLADAERVLCAAVVGLEGLVHALFG